MVADAVPLPCPASRVAAASRGKSGDGMQRAEADVAMDRYAAGDDAAFAIVYDALAPRLYASARAPRTCCNRRCSTSIAPAIASSPAPR
jgi:hypothetical protein